MRFPPTRSLEETNKPNINTKTTLMPHIRNVPSLTISFSHILCGVVQSLLHLLSPYRHLIRHVPSTWTWAARCFLDHDAGGLVHGQRAGSPTSKTNAVIILRPFLFFLSAALLPQPSEAEEVVHGLGAAHGFCSTVYITSGGFFLLTFYFFVDDLKGRERDTCNRSDIWLAGVHVTSWTGVAWTTLIQHIIAGGL